MKSVSFIRRALSISPIICLICFAASAQTLDNAAILKRKQIPILCYHQIREWKQKDRSVDKQYIMPPATFRAHMKLLADSGYHTILPDQLFDYLTKGTPLPAKPIMLTFDDTNEDQYREARPELMKYGFKGVYFIITAKTGTHKWFMDAKQIKQLADEGNTIACHTRNHGDFRKLTGNAWALQIDSANKTLEAITHKPVKYFAFPYGMWSSRNLPGLHQHGFLAAFQLDAPRDPHDPVMTIRRLMDDGRWSVQTLNRNIKRDFGAKSNTKQYHMHPTKKETAN
jgi:peptidoglycan/xylan/chitin deacetylase (PgdA/CDA1 family)